MKNTSLVVLLAGTLALAMACGDDSPPPEDSGVDSAVDSRPPMDSAMDGSDATPDAGPRDWPGMAAPTSHVIVDGVRRDDLLVPVPAGAENPTTMEATPAELNNLYLLRYRQDVEPAAAPRAVVIVPPALLAAASVPEAAAAALVSRSVAAGEPIEVWCYERRGNLLEDLRGADTAEAAGNPEIAFGYYFGGETIDGEAFPDYLTGDDMSYASEWGLAMEVAELQSIIARIPETERQTRVFLMGHADGGELADLYAAWRFEDGSRGVEDVAGLILIDTDEIGRADPITETEYTDDPIEGDVGGLITVRGITALRAEGTTRIAEIPLLGLDLFALTELMMMRATLDPDGVVNDVVRDSTLSLLTDVPVDEMPVLTNATSYGLAFDAEYAAFGIIALNLGSVDGPVESYLNFILGDDLLHPSDPTHRYGWVDRDATDPVEFTSLDAMVRLGHRGPVNSFDWYYPVRHLLDAMAVRGGGVPDDGYQAAAGLRAFDSALMDAPVLGFTVARATTAHFDDYRGRIAAEIGPGRPAAGELRASSTAAFQVVDVPNLTHADAVNAVDDDAFNPIPRDTLAFIYANAAAGPLVGTVDLPAPTAGE